MNVVHQQSPLAADAERVARVALSCLIEPGSRALGLLIQRVGAVAALDALHPGATARPAQSPAVQRLLATAAVRMTSGDPAGIAEAALSRTDRIGARVLIPSDPDWPRSLADLRSISEAGPDRLREDTFPPVCLWVRGKLPLGEAMNQSVSIVGARAATGYGQHVATELAFGVAGRDWTVVSGGAYGIDAAAHRGALAAGGTTVAVLASGVDRPYPSGNASLFERVVDEGLLISEWPPGTEPHRHRFLIRNRVIAALTRGTVVVEASARSGARQTLGRALQLGRAGMVVPGPVTSAMSVGCHAAIRQWSARLVTSVAEVLEEVGRIGDDLAPLPRAPDRPQDLLDPATQQVLDAVRPRRAQGIAEIAATAGVPLRRTMDSLMLLEQGGFVVRGPDGFVLAARTGARGTRPRHSGPDDAVPPSVALPPAAAAPAPDG